jgi:hypothetical protein
MPGKARIGQLFGRALVAGDFNGGYDELVIGVPSWSDIGSSGSVLLLRGTAPGLTAQGVQRWRSGRKGVQGEAGEHWFGDTLAVGRFSGSGHLDLAIGNPGADSVDTGSAGVVHVLRGTPNGLTATGDQLWSEYILGTRRECSCEPTEHPTVRRDSARRRFWAWLERRPGRRRARRARTGAGLRRDLSDLRDRIRAPEDPHATTQSGHEGRSRQRSRRGGVR